MYGQFKTLDSFDIFRHNPLLYPLGEIEIGLNLAIQPVDIFICGA